MRSVRRKENVSSMFEYPKARFSQLEMEHPEEVFNTSNRINEAFAGVPEFIQKLDLILPDGFFTRYKNELYIDISKDDRTRFHNGLLAIFEIVETSDQDLVSIYTYQKIFTVDEGKIYYSNARWNQDFSLRRYFESGYVYNAWKSARKYLHQFLKVNSDRIPHRELYSEGMQ